MSQLKERLKAPTPAFFKKLKKIGLAIAAVGAAIVTAPISLPAIIVTIGGYLALAGGVTVIVSQTAKEGE